MNNEIVKESKFKGFVKKHKVAIIICGAVTAVVGLLAFKLVYDITSSIIPDKNGDEDFSVVTFTDEEIKNTVYSNYGGIGNGQFHDGERSDIDDFLLEDVDYDMTKYMSISMNGILIVNATKTQADSMNLSITSTVESGNTEIFVFVDNELYEEVEINSTADLLLNGIAGKTVYVKAACENANMDIEVNREILDNNSEIEA